MKKPKIIKAWAVMSGDGGIMDIKYGRKPKSDDYYNIGTWTYPVGDRKVKRVEIKIIE